MLRPRAADAMHVGSGLEGDGRVPTQGRTLPATGVAMGLQAVRPERDVRVVPSCLGGRTRALVVVHDDSAQIASVFGQIVHV